MRIKEAEYTIELQRDDVNDIAYSILHNLRSSIETHYKHLQQNKDGEDVFFDHNKNQLKIMEFMFGIMGDSQQYAYYMEEFKGMFSSRRKERLSKDGNSSE